VEYVQCWDVQRAALKAGYGPTYAVTGAYKLPKLLLPYIRLLQDQIVATSDVTVSTVLREYGVIAFSNEDDFHDVTYDDKTGKRTVKAKRWDALTRAQKSAVKDFYDDADGNPRYQLHEKVQALGALGKYLGMFNDKLIVERRNVNVNARFDFSNVPTEKLVELESQLKSLAAGGVTIDGATESGE
jgi:hypothetical protein